MATYTKPEVESKHFPTLLKSLPSLEGKTVAITGTSSGTGFVLAGAVASLNARVLLLNRASSRADAALEKLKAAHPKATFVPITCDLQDFASVKDSVAEILKITGKDGLDVLVNNAGVMALPDRITKDGYEVQMQTNHHSHFLLTRDLFPALTAAAEKNGQARIVNHSSGAARGPPLEKKYFEESKDDALGGFLDGDSGFKGAQWMRYHMTKLANQVFTHALTDKLTEAGSKVIATVCHPGLAATELQVTTNKAGGMGTDFTNQFMGEAQSAEDGTCGILMAAASPDVKPGGFYGPPGRAGAAQALPLEDYFHDAKSKDMLWTVSVAVAGGDFDFKSKL